MECLSPERIVAYLRGGDVDARAVEAHVRDCPACGMELLLGRETLQGLRHFRNRDKGSNIRWVDENILMVIRK